MKRNEFIDKHSIDSDIFLKYKEIKRPLFINSLNNIMPYTKAECLNAIISIKKLIATLKSSSLDASIKNSYLKKFKNEILKLKFLSNSIDCFDKKNFKISKKLYLLPKKDIFQNICYRYEKLVLDKIKDEAPLSDLEKEFISIIKKNSEKNKNRITQKQFKKVSENYSDKISKFDFIDDNKIYTPVEAKDIIDNVLLVMDCKYFSKLSDIPNFFINLRRRTLHIPNESISGKSLKKNILHEIECHLNRRCNGKKSELQIMSIGTDSYEFFEEGLAKFFEQIHKDKFYDYGGLEKYFAISLVRGLFDNKKKNKQESQDIMFIFYKLYFEYYRKNPSYEKIARNKSKKITNRIFRGFTGETPGCCLTKDLMYRESNILIWREFCKEEKIDFDLIMSGKFNYFNKNDIKLVNLIKKV